MAAAQPMSTAALGPDWSWAQSPGMEQGEWGEERGGGR